MITREHESGIDFYQQFPQALSTVLSRCGIDISDGGVCDFVSERFTETSPAELYADGVVVVDLPEGGRLVVIVEVQRQAPDDAKVRAWVRYAAGAWARYRCPVVLLVHCPSDSQAEACANPIKLGPVGTLFPSVFAPRQVPLINDVSAWDGDITLALVSAFMHAHGPNYRQAVTAISDILAKIDHEPAARYATGLLRVLPAEANHLMEDLMATGTHDYQDVMKRFEERGEKRGEKRGEMRGEMRGEAKALLRMLRVRGFEVPTSVERQILDCTDNAKLDSWIDRAVAINDIDELFGPESAAS